MSNPKTREPEAPEPEAPGPEAPGPEAPGPEAPEPDTEMRHPAWTVWRQDDNGNQYEVSRHDSRADAESAVATLEARGHKQTYWVARRPRPH